MTQCTGKGCEICARADKRSKLISNLSMKLRNCENCGRNSDDLPFCRACTGAQSRLSLWTESVPSLKARAEAMLAEREATLSSIYRAWKAWRDVRVLGIAGRGPRLLGCAPDYIIVALDYAVEGWKARDA